MEYTPYKKVIANLSDDEILDVADYAVTTAGVMGAGTTLFGAALCATQATRLAFTPEKVEKPRNEQAKLIASVAGIALGNLSGNKRAASALELIAKAIIDSTIND